MKKNSKKKGFTLIELIVVIAILGILAAVLIPKFTGFTKKANSTQALVDAKQFATAMDSLNAEKGTAFVVGDVTGMANMSSDSSVVAADFDATNGKFTITTTKNGSTFTAGRTAYGQEVHILSGL